MSRIRAFTMPKWGIEMTEGTIADWTVKEGDSFKRGQTLCLIETAKITNEVDAEYDATVRRIIVPGGSEAEPVGALLAVFDEGDHSDAEIDAFVASFKPAEGGLAKGAASAKAAAQEDAESAPAPMPEKPRTRIETNRPISPEALRLAEEEGVDIAVIEGSGRQGRITHQDVIKALRGPANSANKGVLALDVEDFKVFASPLARRLASLHGIALGELTGTGPRGRISKADVLALVPKPSVAAATTAFVVGENRPEIVPFDRVRKVVAQRLTQAKQELPHFYLRMSASADALLDMRKTANLVLGCKASVNDWIVKASAMALARHPDVNVQVHGEQIHRFPHADVSIAVASPKGLVTPVVRQANLMRIDQLAAETRRLIDKAQGKGLSMTDMEGGTFSVSNLGMFGIENFDAIINPPQGAILAVGAALRQPVETAAGGVAFETRISFTLSVDHRAIDGAAGAQFLQTLKSLIEEPAGLFA
ncbi:pyruvate dehydrogenase E2 component (dihydrolipoamide acetyltransferase) [Novosphingobium chloroacetimidivorans]|uniref:Dihydrolipoamide acetyltransferase component of pyruvate dehydrogenase complex n=1 Tax=Novosphingobium chloroacetimidivorans TaxID=1428314 RepID=A0A7W7K9C6_9SPHN|nr:2-oxo acid dehydrogenase subunit E2 [Novosphingobium chloroacetimidivorans]MBB4858375.1 pyruvate dehydrogenase E2 component (dihydrolipoamide acetyltransferase) [Novosphingobium chloroacetimidivorans]